MNHLSLRFLDDVLQIYLKIFLAFAYGHVLPVYLKTVFNLALLVVGFFFYCVVEFVTRKK